MGAEKSGRKNRAAAFCVHFLCALAVMAAAVLVRLPAALYDGDKAAVKEAYTDEAGVPYLTDLDSYYHVRLVRNQLENGMLGDTRKEDGTAWDSLRFYPEGSAADYQPGIIWVTAGLQRIFGGSPEKLEYSLAAVFAAFSALAAYLLGRRTGGIPGGLAAGLLVGCGPVYAARSCFGRFDTDVFVILLELLLILFLTGALRAENRRKRIAQLAGFALTTVAYFLFWLPTYAAMFVGLTLAGGVIAVPAMILADPQNRPKTAGAFFRRAEIRVIAAGIGLAAAGLAAVAGPSIFGTVLGRLFSFSTTSQTGEGAMPNLFASISELAQTGFFPRQTGQMFSGYVAGEAPAAVNGIGGAAAFIAALAGLAFLILACFPRFREKLRPESPRAAATYACVYGIWLAAGLFLTRYGVRFIEHLSIPVGLLAAAFTGQIVRLAGGKPAEKRKEEERRRIPLRKAAAAVLCLTVAIPAVTGAARSAGDSRPSVTDASARAMEFIRNNAGDDEALIASWWDMGYFYESESGHPCLWDGGSQDSNRAILVSRALVTDDLELSRRILLMLAGSGNEGVDLLLEHTDPKTAYETLWAALTQGREEAKETLRAMAGLTEAEAEEAEALIHPAQAKEAYLVITYTMTQQIGWYEYYSNWDFTGKQALPSATLYSYTPEGTPLFNTKSGQAYLEGVRGKEAMWQLFFAAVQTPCFTPAFEWHDGMEHVRVWRVEPAG